MMRRRGNKKRVELERNYRSTLVILALEDREKYLRQLEEELKMFKKKKNFREGTSKTNINDELINLAYKKILTRTHKKNKVYYKVDWDVICSHFIRHISKMIKKRYKEDPFVSISKYRNNKYFLELIKISFGSNFELFKTKRVRLKTIGDIFEEVVYEIVYYMRPHEEGIDKKRLARDKDLREFREFSETLFNVVVGQDKADSLGEFFDEHLSTKVYMGSKTPKKNK
jgi:hypothetical protein